MHTNRTSLAVLTTSLRARAPRGLSATLLVLFAAGIAAGCGGEDSKLLRKESRLAVMNGGPVVVRDVPDGSVCVFGDADITEVELQKLMDQATGQYEAQKQPVPKEGSKEYTDLQGQAIDYLIQQEMVKQSAKASGVKVSDKEIDKRLDELKQQYFEGDEKKYKSELAKSGMTEAELKDQLGAQLLSDKLKAERTEGIKVSEADAEKYFEKNKDQFGEPASRKVAHILVKEKKLADEIYEQVKDGDEKLFTALAKKHSTDPGSKDTGGVYDAKRGQMVAEFDKAAFELETGEVSKPVKTEFGYHVITARTDITEGKAPKFDEVADQIKGQLEQEKMAEADAEATAKMQKDAKSQVNCRKGYSWNPTPPIDPAQAAQQQAAAQAQAQAAPPQ